LAKSALEALRVYRQRSFDPAYCVGREAELSAVRSLVADAALGNGCALVWIGASGIGKSRLLSECERLKLPATTLRVRCGAPATYSPDICAQIVTALRLPRRSTKARAAPAVLSALTVRAKRRPVAIFVDNLHLAGGAERSFVEALAARARHQRLVIVACTRRDTALPAQLIRELPPLDDAAMELLIRGLSEKRSLDNEGLRAILATAQGNPRLAIELAQSDTADDGTVTLVPPSAHDLLREFREALSQDDYDIVAACSVVGAEFDGEWISEVTGRSRAEVADALQRASEAGLLGKPAGSPKWLAFRQIAVRNAIYASIIAIKRQIIHERIVERLVRERGGSAKIDALLGLHAEVIAKHELAAEAFSRAADGFRDAGAFAAAAELHLRAAANVPLGDERWLALMRQAMRCYRSSSDWKRVNSLAESVLAHAAADANVAAAALEDLFYAHLNDGNREAAEGVAERIAGLGLPASGTRGQIARLILAYAFCYSGMTAKAQRLVEMVEAQGIDDPELRLRYLIATVEIEALVAPLERTLKVVDEAVEIARGLGVRGTVFAAGTGAEIACRYGDLARAREYVERAERIAEQRPGSANDLLRGVVKERTRIAMLAGDLPAARELVRANIGWRATGRLNESFDAGIAVSLGMRIGDLALVDAFFDPRLLYDSVAAQEAEACGLLLPGFAEVMLLRGMAKELRGALERCVGDALIDPYTSIQLAATRHAPLECSAAAVEQVERYFANAIAPSAAAHVALARATLLRRSGRHIAAAELAGAAAVRFRALGWALYEAAALELAGNLRSASRLYRECGAVSDVARLATGEKRKLRYAAFGARLSPREREVARLVAAKRSNRDIALALDISVRTVDHHVEAAFSKLGIRNRWQLDADMLEPRPNRRPA
jgi:DNA-binding CsgD family transcriptional regulator